jgi:hypothetical protein
MVTKDIRMFASMSVRAARICLILIPMIILGCAAQPVIDPPQDEIVQRMDRIILLVDADTGLEFKPMDEILVGAGDSAAYASGKVAAGGARLGGSFIVLGCVGGAGTGIGWVVFCPAGLATGAAVGVGSVLVGAPVAAVIGAGMSHDQNEIESSRAVIEEVEDTIERRLSDAFRDRLIVAVKSIDHARTIDNDTDGLGIRQPVDDESIPIIILVKIDDFDLVRDGRLNPEIVMHMDVSTEIYDVPEAGLLYTRHWSYSVDLGDYFKLTSQDGSVLVDAIREGLGLVAEAVTKDLYLVDTPDSDQYAEASVSKLTARHEAEYARRYDSTQPWFDEHKQKAACGELEAQIALGKAYADINTVVFGDRGRDALIDGYYWLSLAQLSSEDDIGVRTYLDKLNQQLEADEIVQAENRALQWDAIQCGDENKR